MLKGVKCFFLFMPTRRHIINPRIPAKPGIRQLSPGAILYMYIYIYVCTNVLYTHMLPGWVAWLRHASSQYTHTHARARGFNALNQTMRMFLVGGLSCAWLTQEEMTSSSLCYHNQSFPPTSHHMHANSRILRHPSAHKVCKTSRTPHGSIRHLPSALRSQVKPTCGLYHTHTQRERRLFMV